MQTSKRFAIRNFSLRNRVICWQSQEKGVGRATISTTKKRSKHANPCKILVLRQKIIVVYLDFLAMKV